MIPKSRDDLLKLVEDDAIDPATAAYAIAYDYRRRQILLAQAVFQVACIVLIVTICWLVT